MPRLPSWLRTKLVAAWGESAVAAMEQAHFQGAPLDLTAKDESLKLAKELGGQLLPTGTIRLSDPGQVSALPGYDAGRWWVQDAAAAIPAKLLNAAPGMQVLDLCAAPGGKTLQLAQTGADVTAVDISTKRLERLRANLTRTKLSAKIVVSDALKMGGKWDAVLLDAPCSATGTIRRHPDLPFAKEGSDFADLIQLQTQLLRHALTLLKPGGRLIYCTCSLLPEEGEYQISELLSQNPQVQIDARLDPPLGLDPTWQSAEGGWRLRPDLWPEHGGMDGFYIAALCKTG